MSKENKTNIIYTSVLFAAFVIFTICVKFINVEPIGPNDSLVGLAGLNQIVEKLFPYNEVWYKISEVLGIIAILCAVFFAGLGVFQTIKRKSLKKVDADLFVLAGLYVVVLAFYAFFEVVKINYRPILVDSKLEASYPSSHTLLSICILFSTADQVMRRVQKKPLKMTLTAVSFALALMIIIGRLLSGAHWVTDIVGSILLGESLFVAYIVANSIVKEKLQAKNQSENA